MATFLLVRHAVNDMVGKELAGRLPDVHLNEMGKAQAERLAEKLAAMTDGQSGPVQPLRTRSRDRRTHRKASGSGG